MEFSNIYISGEIVVHILKICDIYSLYNFCKSSKTSKNLVKNNIDYICKHHKNLKLNNFFRQVMSNMNNDWNIYHKFMFLLENYQYEEKRLKILDTNGTPFSYCFSIASQGFYPFRNFTDLINLGFSEVIAISVIRTIPKEKFHLVKFLFKEGFNESDVLQVVSTKDTESVYRLINLSEKGFMKIVSIQAIFNLNFDQIDSMVYLKKANFLDEYCYYIARDYDKYQINKILMLKNYGFNYTNSIRCATQLCHEKFSLLVKLRNKYPNHNNLTQLVFQTSIRNLENIIVND